MTPLRLATSGDLDALLPLMAEFHEHEGIQIEPGRRRGALARLLGDASLGRVLLAVDGDGAIQGYAVLCLGYSVEFGGRDAFVDELFVVSAQRGRGLGQQLVAEAERQAKAAGVEAIHLEADHANPRAADLYRRLGFKDHARHLMTKRLG